MVVDDSATMRAIIQTIKQILQVKKGYLLAVAFKIVQEGPGRGAGIDAVEKVGVILAQFRLKNRLLLPKGEQAELGWQRALFSAVRPQFTGQQVAEEIKA